MHAKMMNALLGEIKAESTRDFSTKANSKRVFLSANPGSSVWKRSAIPGSFPFTH